MSQVSANSEFRPLSQATPVSNEYAMGSSPPSMEANSVWMWSRPVQDAACADPPQEPPQVLAAEARPFFPIPDVIFSRKLTSGLLLIDCACLIFVFAFRPRLGGVRSEVSDWSQSCQSDKEGGGLAAECRNVEVCSMYGWLRT